MAELIAAPESSIYECVWARSQWGLGFPRALNPGRLRGGLLGLEHAGKELAMVLGKGVLPGAGASPWANLCVPGLRVCEC